MSRKMLAKETEKSKENFAAPIIAIELDNYGKYIVSKTSKNNILKRRHK